LIVVFRRSDPSWYPAGALDRSSDVAEGVIELSSALGADALTKARVVVVRPSGREKPLLRLRRGKRTRATVVASPVDYARLGEDASTIEMRPLTRAEAARRSGAKTALPALAFIAAVAALVASFVGSASDIASPIAALAAVPATVIAIRAANRA
jgi:hypothetical protein